MKNLLFCLIFLVSSITFSQTSLSDYSYVIVPEQYEFLKGRDQFKINSMTKFYLEKSGFNAFFTSDAPNANRCEGLYANIEELSSFLGTKVQVVLKDCNGNEVYRSPEGKSKYKEHDKKYQDALREAFTGLEIMNVKQKDVVLLNETSITENASNKTEKTKPATEVVKANNKENISITSIGKMPSSKFSNYSNNGKTYLLRKTDEGYSLYEESATAKDGLLLIGTISTVENGLHFTDSSGNEYPAQFDASENLTINMGDSTMVFQAEN